MPSLTFIWTLIHHFDVFLELTTNLMAMVSIADQRSKSETIVFCLVFGSLERKKEWQFAIF